jgi:1-acyl-sn-glycerol-3-phosphate acyltransferase
VADFVYPPVIAALRGSFFALGLKIDLRGAEKVPRTGPLVVASNHISHLDFIFAGLAARPAKRYVRFMAKQSVFEHSIGGPLMRGMHHIPVDRDAGTASIREALGALRAGEAVGIFPEATISRSFEPKEFKTGAVRIAKGGKAPIVPVAVWGTQRLWTYDKHSSLKQRGVPITVIVGEPIDSSGDPEAATAELRSRIIEMVHTAQETYPDDGTGQWWQPARLGGTAPEPG